MNCKESDRTPYTYLIGWSNNNKWYYGVRFAKNCHPQELWKTYFTSSKYVKEYYKQFGEPDTIEVRKIFDSIEDARAHEHKVLKRLNVIKKDNWLNEHNGTSPSLECALKGAKTKKPYKENDSRRLKTSLRMKTPKRMQQNLELLKIMQSEECILKAKKTKEEKRKNGEYDELYMRMSITKSEKYKSGEYDEVRAQISNSLKEYYKVKIESGWKHPNWFSSEFGKSMADKNNSDTQCPHCFKIGQYRAMKRWHYDNCKFKENIE